MAAEDRRGGVQGSTAPVAGNPTDTESDFVADYAKLGTSACQRCKTKLPIGCLRIARIVKNPYRSGNMSKYYHPACIFESFLHVRAFTSVIQSVNDIKGFEGLKADDQLLVSTLVDESCESVEDRITKLREANRGNQKAQLKAEDVNKTKQSHRKALRLDLSQLTVLYTNADVLTREKRSELEMKVIELKPHFVLVNEVLPKSYTEPRGIMDFTLPGFTPHPTTFDDSHRGLITHVHSSLDNYVEEVDVVKGTHPEHCWLSINLRGKDRLLLGHIYRSPQDNHIQLRQHITEVLTAHGGTHSYLCIVGDFNYPDINWVTGSTPGSRNNDGLSPEGSFVEMTRDLFLTQHTKGFTRSRGTDEPSLLDLVFTNEPRIVSEIVHHAPLGKSDHQILTFTLDCYVEPPKPQLKYCYGKGNYVDMASFFGAADWESEGTVSQRWETLSNTILKAQNQYIPTKLMSAKPSWESSNAPTNDRATRDIQLNKNRAHRLSIEHRHRADAEEYRLQYNKARNKATAHNRRRRKLFEQDIAKDAKVNPKRFWQYCQSKTRARSGISPLLKDPKDKNSIVNQNVEKAEVLQKQFCSVFTNEGEEQLPEFQMRCNAKIGNFEVTEETVRKKLKALNITKSAGPDGVHPRVLRECADTLCKPLTAFFQACIDAGEIPNA